MRKITQPIQEGTAIPRVTISDIADRAGVSKGAVSYALNDKPGVSSATRKRVLEIARELGWNPSQAARSLSTSRADAIGLVIARPPRLLGVEPFYMEFVAGIEDALSSTGDSLLLQMASKRTDEIAVYEKWWAQRRVDGVLLVDLTQNDERIEAVTALGLPAVTVTSETASPLPNVWTDDRGATQDAVRYLVRLGHRKVARVGGLPHLTHTGVRNTAFLESAADAGLESHPVVTTDYTDEAGAQATRSLLTAQDPPTAIIYDNDIMAVAGLGVASELGVPVPSQLSLLAWDDSGICSITHPPLSAMRRDIPALGSAAAELLIRVIAGESPPPVEGPRPILYPRGSTAAPPRS